MSTQPELPQALQQLVDYSQEQLNIIKNMEQTEENINQARTVLQALIVTFNEQTNILLNSDDTLAAATSKGWCEALMKWLETFGGGTPIEESGTYAPKASGANQQKPLDMNDERLAYPGVSEETQDALHMSLEIQEAKNLSEAFVACYGEFFSAAGPKGPVFLYDKKSKLWKEISVGQFSVRISFIMLPIYNLWMEHASEAKEKSKDTEFKNRAQQRITQCCQLLQKLAKPYFCEGIARWTCNWLADPKLCEHFNKTDNIIPVREGKIVNLTTGEVNERTHEHYFTEELDAVVGYSGKQVMLYVSQMMLEDDEGNTQERTKFLQRLIGYAFTGTAKEKILAVLIGDGDNGKSMLSEGLKALCRFMVKSTCRSVLLGNSRPTSGPSPDVHALRGARVAITPEVNQQDHINEDTMKRLTGRDTISSRTLNQDYLEWQSRVVPFMLTNPEPICSGDQATLNRICLIRFQARFCENPTLSHERKVNKDLADIWKNLEARSQLLAWIIEGAVEYNKQGLNPPASVQADNAAYKRNQSTIQCFLEEDIEIVDDDKSEVRMKDLYNRFIDRCKSMDKRVDSSARLGKQLTKYMQDKLRITGDKFKRTSNGTIYSHLKLKEVEFDFKQGDTISSLLSF